MPAIEPPTLSDGALILRPPRLDDADAVTAACQDPAIQRWTFVPSPYRREHAEQWLSTRPDDTVTLLAFEEGRLAGSFSLMEIGYAPRASHRGRTRPPGPAYGEVGYWVAAEARGRGVATRAVRLLHGWATEQLGLTRLEILPHVDNAASRRVAERCGYADTGERRKAPRGPDAEPVYAVYAWEA